MFTGIVETTGRIVETRASPGGRRVRLDIGPVTHECHIGDSLCVSGVCLTVAGTEDGFLDFDVITETLNKTTLGERRVGDRVNVERSLRVGDRLDGHFVQGHVDGTATVEDVVHSVLEFVVRLRPIGPLLPYMIPKGSVCVDGVALTIADVDGDTISVALIPTTLERTTLGELRRGDSVNVESDIVVRTIVHRLTEMFPAGLALGTLKEVELT